MSIPRHILLLRHGQTDSNANGVLQGHLPTPLNALGRRQADLLAQRLVGFEPRVQAIISSDLPRALQTAEPIGKALGLTVELDADWRERGFGEFEGKTVGDAEVWRAASGGSDPPGAESAAGFAKRVKRALERVAESSAHGDCVAVVTHGGPVRTVVRMLAEGTLPLADGTAAPELVPIANCSIMHLVAERHDAGRRWRVVCLNEAAHLAGLKTQLDAG